jgi:AraC family L-rhamnose operon regulatory protein RhaS
VGYWDAQGIQDWGLPWHRNEGIEIMFLESGKITFAVGAKDHLLHPDALTIARPWETHRVGDPNIHAGTLHWLILDVGVRRPNQSWKWPEWIMLSGPDKKELTDMLRQTDQPVWKASGEIRHCFQEIARAVESDRTGSHISVLTIRINEMLLLLLMLLRKHKPRLDESMTSTLRTVELFLDDLCKHPAHLQLEWTLEEMGDSCGLGTTQFVHLVKQITNMTPLQYLNHCRIEHAAVLLRARQAMSITEVAQICGFSSSQYFATVFGRKYGYSPSDFRRSGFSEDPGGA